MIVFDIAVRNKSPARPLIKTTGESASARQEGYAGAKKRGEGDERRKKKK